MNAIKTTRFGKIEYNETDVIHFPLGIVGFPSHKQFILQNHSTEDNPFKWLQSLDDASLAFPVINPLAIQPDYRIQLRNEDISLLDLKNPEEALIYVVLTLPQDKPGELWANLRGPILIHRETRAAQQVVLQNEKYPIRHIICLNKEKEYASSPKA